MSDDDRVVRFFFYALGFLAITGGGAAILLVYRHWTVFNSVALLITGQIVVALGVVAGGAVVTTTLVQISFRTIQNIQNNYAVQIETAKQRTPTFLAGTALVGEAWILIGDKAFRGNSVKTIIATLVAFLLFALANHLACSTSKWRNAWWAAWLVAFLWIPVAIYLDRRWSLHQLFEFAMSFSLEARVVTGLVLATLLFLPLAFPSREELAD